MDPRSIAPRHICVLLHGVETAAGEISWAERLEAVCQNRTRTPIEFIARSYGGLLLNKTSALMTLAWAPYRKKIVDREEEFFKLLYSSSKVRSAKSDLGPEPTPYPTRPSRTTRHQVAANRVRGQKVVRDPYRFGVGHGTLDRAQRVSVIAHSFGGYVVSELLKRGHVFHRIVLVAPAAPEDFDWWKYEDQFGLIFVYWSSEDEVIPWAYYGRMGYVGPKIKHGRVLPIKHAMRHSEYFTPGGRFDYFTHNWIAALEDS